MKEQEKSSSSVEQDSIRFSKIIEDEMERIEKEKEVIDRERQEVKAYRIKAEGREIARKIADLAVKYKDDNHKKVIPLYFDFKKGVIIDNEADIELYKTHDRDYFEDALKAVEEDTKNINISLELNGEKGNLKIK